MPLRSSLKCEIEIKLRIVNLEALISDLRLIGAKSNGRVLERNVLYDTAGSHFRKGGCLLRLRTQIPARSRLARGGKRGALLTCKTHAQSAAGSRYKQNIEREVALASVRNWHRLVTSLGLRATFRYEKYRTMYRADGLVLDVDETPVGTFLELEGDTAAIDRMARRLGFGPRDYFRGTYWDLHAAECRRRGRVPGNMLFPA